MAFTLGLFPLPEPAVLNEVFEELAAVLRERRYTAAHRLPLAGGIQHTFFDLGNLRRYLRHEDNVHEMSGLAPAFYRAFAAQEGAAMELFRAFALSQPIARGRLVDLIGTGLVERLTSLGVLVEQAEGVWSRVTAAPIGGRLICFHDNDRIHNGEKAEHVFLGRCSVRLARKLAQATAARRFARALDLCTGSGVQALIAAGACDDVLGVDINPRAVAFARANARANQIDNVRFAHGDLWDPVEGTFDLISANTPFLLLPEHSRALSGNGGRYGLDVTLRIYERFDERLRPGGQSHMVISTAYVSGRSLLDEKLHELFDHKGYRMELQPISTYYDPKIHQTYQSLGVDRCTLYVASLERAGDGFALHEEKRSPLTRLAYAVHIARSHAKGRRLARGR